MNTGAMTAISRKQPSMPMRYLAKKGYLRGRKLDYGCGRGFDATHFRMHRFDPHWSPEMPDGLFDTITCHYVLNVVPPHEAIGIVDRIQERLAPKGRAYITVRRDLDHAEQSGRGCMQYLVKLSLPIVTENKQFCIYELCNN